MDKSWFDLRAQTKRTYAQSVWVPLHISHSQSEGEYSDVGYREIFEGAHAIAVLNDQRKFGDDYSWSSNTEARPWAEPGIYKPADIYAHNQEIDVGFRLGLRQSVSDQPEPVWHLHQDFVIALELIREGDAWLRPAESYTEVARLRRDAQGKGIGIEVKAEFLRDYLCARNCALRIASYRQRSAKLDTLGNIDFGNDGAIIEINGGRLEERAWAVDKSGGPFGSAVAVFHASRTDVDPDDDVPMMGPETADNVTTKSWSFTREDGKLYTVMAEFWRDEWIEPAAHSLRVRRDEVPSQVSFITEADGTRVGADELRKQEGRWLWFSAGVIRALLDRRGAKLEWHSRDTAGISTPSDPSIHFGINDIGLVTVYAKDIARLPEWERRMWSGFNVTPEGKVSAELLAAQVQAEPADTQAPERYFSRMIAALATAWRARFGTELFRGHDQAEDIALRVHRFRAVDRAGLLALAKDVARLTADSIDASVAQQVAPAKNGEGKGSLKSLERALASMCGDNIARKVTGPLAAAYDLRLSDAHLPKSDLLAAYALLGIDEHDPPLKAGYKMLHAVVSSLNACTMILRNEFPKRSAGAVMPADPSDKATGSSGP